jgi:ribosomal protein S27E
MSKPKQANYQIMSVELQCPHCGQTITSPGGSMFWEVAEIHEGNVGFMVCRSCEKKVAFPTGYRKVRL